MKNPHLIRRFCDHIGRNRYRYVTLALALLVARCGIEGCGIWEASRLECTTTALSAKALAGAGPLKIALLTDIHNNPDLFGESIRILRQQKPDLIIFGGDFVMAHDRFMRTRWAVNGLRNLAAIAPTYAILGNHDYEKLEQVERVFATAGVPILRNEAIDWKTPSGTTIRLIGLGDWNEGDEAPERCMRPDGQEEAPVLLLSHDPESRWLLRRYDWDLMLSGHTHGGQLGIPFTNRYLSFRSSMPAGLFDFEGGRRVYVSRGIGSIWGIRYFCRPEVSIITIGSH